MKCIYCRSDGPFNKEHALPRLFGEFTGHPYLSGVCKDCNHKIGQAEAQLTHSGPEALHRRLLNIKGRRRKKGKNPFKEGSFGGKAIDMIAPLPEHGINGLWEFHEGKPREVAPQIIIENHQKKSLPLRVQSEWLDDPQTFMAFRKTEEFRNFTRGKPFSVFILASDDEQETQNLRRLILTMKEDLPEDFEWDTPGPCIVSNPVAYFKATDSYFRAVAKCVFHYFLAVNHDVEGSEQFFERIRTFIMHGKNFEE